MVLMISEPLNCYALDCLMHDSRPNHLRNRQKTKSAFFIQK